MSIVKVISEDSQLEVELTNAKTKLVVVGFTAKWCEHCQQMGPIFEDLSNKYPEVVFLKLDVDNCHETPMSHDVSTMPTFVFYRNKIKLDRFDGCDKPALEAKIEQFRGRSRR